MYVTSSEILYTISLYSGSDDVTWSCLIKSLDEPVLAERCASCEFCISRDIDVSNRSREAVLLPSPRKLRHELRLPNALPHYLPSWIQQPWQEHVS